MCFDWEDCVRDGVAVAVEPFPTYITSCLPYLRLYYFLLIYGTSWYRTIPACFHCVWYLVLFYAVIEVFLVSRFRRGQQAVVRLFFTFSGTIPPTVIHKRLISSLYYFLGFLWVGFAKLKINLYVSMSILIS